MAKSPHSLTVIIPKRNPEMDFRRSTILSMLRYMTLFTETTEMTLKTIFDSLKDKAITSIKCHLVFVINERPIIYVKSITINNCEIPIHLGFYKSTGTSRYDRTIKDYWFPTTQMRCIANDCYKLDKPEDNYILKYDHMTTLSTNEDEIKEQDMLMKYGRFINENNALVSYFLHNKNKLVSELVFEQFKMDTNKYSINYTDYLQEPELIMMMNH
jgi:hypothetical protein